MRAYTGGGDIGGKYFVDPRLAIVDDTAYKLVDQMGMGTVMSRAGALLQ